MSTYYHESTIQTLRLFSAVDGYTTTSLAEKLGVSRAVAKNRIDNLHSKQLIDSRRNSVPFYFITDKGKQLLRRYLRQDDMGDAPEPRRHIPTETYDGSDLRPFTAREGAMRAYELPSRGF